MTISNGKTHSQWPCSTAMTSAGFHPSAFRLAFSPGTNRNALRISGRNNGVEWNRTLMPTQNWSAWNFVIRLIWLFGWVRTANVWNLKKSWPSLRLVPFTFFTCGFDALTNKQCSIIKLLSSYHDSVDKVLQAKCVFVGSKTSSFHIRSSMYAIIPYHSTSISFT